MVNSESATLASGAAINIEVAQGVAQTAVTNTGDVVEGSLIKQVHIEMWIKSRAVAGSHFKFQLALEKVMGAQAAITFAQMNNLMAYPNKKNIFHTAQGIGGDLTTQSIPIMNDWFAIPKGKQRFGLDDQLVLTISATTSDLQRCGLFIFKEWK